MPSLQGLTLRGCPSVSDRGLRQLRCSFPQLRQLDLSWCYNITDSGLESVRSGLMQLCRIDLLGCQCISDSGRKGLVGLQGNKFRSMRSRSYQRFVDTCAS